jgi:crossover junction endodeoxyribonuclease RuvC
LTKKANISPEDPGIPEDFVPLDCPWPIVLGFDPGTHRAGWGALLMADKGPRLLGCGVLEASAKLSPPERLGRMSVGLDLLLDRLRPSTVVVERAFAFRNVQSALRIAEARGLALAGASRRGMEVIEITPAAAKKAVSGNGAASKEQVAAMISRRLSIDVDGIGEDATDALALALAYCERARFEAVLRRTR